MRQLTCSIHPDIASLNGRIFQRRAARGIILNGDNILLLYTERYQDYTLPGGGVEDDESLVQGLIREVTEETGARNIRNIVPFGYYEEYRPWYKPNADIMHMLSYCYRCDIDNELDAPQLESYEHQNGMKPLWINIYDAIAHNEHTMANSEKKGMSIERETFLFKLIAQQCVEASAIKQAG